MLTNALRAHLAEYGLIAARGPSGMAALMRVLHETQDELPEIARMALHVLAGQLRELTARIASAEAKILEWHRSDATSRRLATIPGIGPITASAIAASVPDASLFRSGRQFAAWLGLTPKAHSSGGKERQAGISKQGDSYLRRLLVVGATAVIRFARQNSASRAWATKLLERKKPKVVAVALANKTARIAWAVLARSEPYAVRFQTA
jgi:transposase